jgi:ubiquinone/menaquinone biosynthesis C-methylase UbiE
MFVPIKPLIKKIIPQHIINKIRNYKYYSKIRAARKTFNTAEENPMWLELEDFSNLQKKYTFPKGEYGYDDNSTEKRGIERADYLLKIIQGKPLNTFLEIGCQDGMVSCILQRKNKNATAIDIEEKWFDGRAIKEGVIFLQMDATALQFNDESFDFVFSYNGFEHFSNPLLVLKEACRVVKKGGFIYINFGSPYMSAKGLHAYHSISVPFCQHLFPKEMILDFIKKNTLTEIDFESVNGWTIDDFRKLWESFSESLKKIKYHETHSYEYLDIINQYPSCFKSKTNKFYDLTVVQIEALFVKK